MTVFRPNRAIWFLALLISVGFTVGVAAGYFRQPPELGLITSVFLFLIGFTLTLAVWSARTARLEVTDEYIQQTGLRPWRLEWENLARVEIEDQEDGCSLVSLHDREGRQYAPLALHFSTRARKASLIRAIRARDPNQPNKRVQPTAPSGRG
jgi:hypothetical protein